MRKEYPRELGGKKPKCSACGHLLEKHTRTGACVGRWSTKKEAVGVAGNCLCLNGPERTFSVQLPRARPVERGADVQL